MCVNTYINDSFPDRGREYLLGDQVVQDALEVQQMIHNDASVDGQFLLIFASHLFNKNQMLNLIHKHVTPVRRYFLNIILSCNY